MYSAKLVITSAAFGMWAFSAGAVSIDPTGAVAGIGRTATVCGVIAAADYRVGSRANPTFLTVVNPDQPDAKRALTAVIYGHDRAKFGHLYTRALRRSAGRMARSVRIAERRRTRTKLAGKSHRPGLYQCNACREPFTVKMGSVMENSHIPYRKWALAFHLMAASKKGMSGASAAPHARRHVQNCLVYGAPHSRGNARGQSGLLGGEGKFVEADETFTGGKAKNRAYKAPPPKEAVMALVERGGKVRSFHIPEVTAATLKPIIVDAIAEDSHFRTDESGVYWEVGEQFASHQDGRSLDWRIRARRRAHKHDRRLLLDL